MLAIKDILAYLEEARIPYRYIGADDLTVDGFSSLKHYRKGTFTWVQRQEKLSEGPALSDIALLFAQESVDVQGASHVIISPESKRAFFSVVEQFYGQPELPSVGHGSYLSPQVRIGKNVQIGCNCVLDGDITVGDDTVIWHNVSMVGRVVMGKRCVIQSGVSIGHEGYAFTEDERGQKAMVKHFGGVALGDGVWIGPNTDIIRGTIDDTYIDDGCKIDACCHIAHNVVMEKSCAVVANSVIMGSVHLCPRVYVASATIRDQVVVGEDAFVGMGAVVTKDVRPGEVVAGVPAAPFHKNGG